MDPRYEDIEARLARAVEVQNELETEIRYLEEQYARVVLEKVTLLERLKAYQDYFRGAM